MDFAAFLADCRAQWPEFDDPRRLARSIKPADRRLADYPKQIRGMATENKLMLLNLAVAHLGPHEVYVEVGCYRGLSLVCAAAGNARASIYACDNFSQFKGSSDQLRQTLAAHTPPGQVRFFDLEFREFLLHAPWRPAQIGVYFYDGGHSFADQYEGLKYALPSFANDALVIIDDTNKRNVRSANRLFAASVKGFEPVLDLRTPRNHSPTWWNGIQLYRVRQPLRFAALDGTSIGYEVRRFLWDDIFLRARHFWRARRNQLRRRLQHSVR
ncbi:MAG TPA: class I SAM-dependent methyltransferase [Candidatus Binataceae bacterium]|nr:class I SAM-dependent methyltransferase [Candidatus Binataceae bacterium]